METKRKKKFVIDTLKSKRITYLIPVQQETIHEPPDDAGARSNLDLLLQCRDLRLAPRGDRVAERDEPLLVQVVVRGVAVRDARNALDRAQEGTQVRPVDRRRRAVPVLPERRVDRQGSLRLHRSAQ
jgi:hypothetical protein